MTQKIVYETAEGGVAVVHLVEGAATVHTQAGPLDEDGNPTVVQVSVPLTLLDHINFSVPVKLLKDGIVAVGVGTPYQAKAGDQLDARIASANKLSYQQVPYKLIDEADLPTDRLFRAAWRTAEGVAVVEDVDAAKVVAHSMRRQAREAEFAPLDKQVMIVAAVPAELKKAEAARQEVRAKYAEVQEAIDACPCTTTLRAALSDAAIV